MFAYLNNFCGWLFIFFASIALLYPTAARADGSIVYSHLTEGYWQIWSIAPDGSGKKQRTFTPVDKRDADWFDQGNKIGYRTSNGQLFIMNRDGFGETEILAQYASINNPHFSKNKDEVVFVRFDPRLIDKSNIWTSDFDGRQTSMLTKGVILRYQPNFSPQSDRIVFVQADDIHKAHHLWLMNADGSDLRQLTFGNGFDNLPAFSPDGTRIVFSSNREDRDYEIYIADVTSGKLNRLTSQPGLDSHPAFSPDGKNIVFLSTRSGSQQIWVMNSDGANPVQLTRENADSIDPVWVAE